MTPQQDRSKPTNKPANKPADKNRDTDKARPQPKRDREQDESTMTRRDDTSKMKDTKPR